MEYMHRGKGFSVGGLHGDLSQSARMEALLNFKTGKTGLLVATDVAARGLDIPNVAAVINYTFPLTIEDYIHRIGRTGALAPVDNFQLCVVSNAHNRQVVAGRAGSQLRFLQGTTTSAASRASWHVYCTRVVSRRKGSNSSP